MAGNNLIGQMTPRYLGVFAFLSVPWIYSGSPALCSGKKNLNKKVRSYLKMKPFSFFYFQIKSKICPPRFMMMKNSRISNKFT